MRTRVELAVRRFRCLKKFIRLSLHQMLTRLSHHLSSRLGRASCVSRYYSQSRTLLAKGEQGAQNSSEANATSFEASTFPSASSPSGSAGSASDKASAKRTSEEVTEQVLKDLVKLRLSLAMSEQHLATQMSLLTLVTLGSLTTGAASTIYMLDKFTNVFK